MATRTFHRIAVFALAAGLLAASAIAQTSPLLSTAPAEEKEPVSVSTAWAADRWRAGDAAVLAVVLSIEAGYHVIADAAQLRDVSDFKPFPTRVRVTEAPAGILGEAPRYPPAKRLEAAFTEGGIASFEGETVIYLPIRIDRDFPPGPAPIRVEVQFQACSTSTCLMPRKLSLTVSLEVVPPTRHTTATRPELFEAFFDSAGRRGDQGVRFDLFGWGFTLDAASSWGLGLLILAAAGGGFLLNLTPCVLPLIPIKIISMSNAAANRRRCLALGASTFGGVVGFWAGLGAVVSTVSGFTSTNQLFQYPGFTICVGAVIAVMAAGMIFGYSTRLPGFVYALNPAQETLRGAFGIGVLTAVLSTPCTAPFMGAAAAWAATQAPATTLAIFLAIGAGMGLPYLVLAALPRLIRRIPKTGPASLLLKQAMGMLMLAAAAYFIGIGLSSLWAEGADPASRRYWWPVMGVIAAAGGWTALRALQLARSRAGKTIWGIVGALVAAAAAAGAVKLTDEGPIAWVAYTPQRMERALEQKQTVVMLFTAEWCLNCKALEQSVWLDPQVAELMSHSEVAPMKVDLTGNNPAGRDKLREAGSLTIPLLVVYAPDGRKLLQSDFYTKDQVVAAVRSASGP